MSNQSVHFLGQLEKEVMELIWVSNEPVTVKFIHESLTQKHKIAYTTVMTIMTRLTQKGFLRRRMEGSRAYSYQSVYTKEKFIARISKQILNNFKLSFGDLAVAHFAKEVEKIPFEKRQKLLKLLKESK